MNLEALVTRDIIRTTILKLDALAPFQQRLETLIAPHYAAASRSASGRKASLAELAAGTLLHACLKVSKEDQLTFTSLGKPVLAEGCAHFNLTHDATYACLAVANQPVGVDIEPIAAPPNNALASKVFSERQIAYLQGDPSEYDLRFTIFWTATEAALKAEGDRFFRFVGSDPLCYGTLEH